MNDEVDTSAGADDGQHPHDVPRSLLSPAFDIPQDGVHHGENIGDAERRANEQHVLRVGDYLTGTDRSKTS